MAETPVVMAVQAFTAAAAAAADLFPAVLEQMRMVYQLYQAL
jgi:hypothetical protein